MARKSEALAGLMGEEEGGTQDRDVLKKEGEGEKKTG